MRAALLSSLALSCSSGSPPPPSAVKPSPAGNPQLTAGTHRALINGSRLVYHVHGQGPVAIALAGGPGFAWDYLRMPEVEKHLTIVYLELLGTGESARLADPKDYSRARDTSDVAALRAHLGIDQVIVLGHSYGGFVALEVALAHPEHLAGLILYDTSAMTNQEWSAELSRNLAGYQDRPWFADASEAFGKLDAAATDDELAALVRRIGPFYLHDYDRDRARWDAWLARARISHARSNLATSAPYDLRPRLGSIATPTLILVGSTDFITSPRMAAILHRGIPGSRLVELEASGHFGHVEEPAAFAAAIAGFVRDL